MSEANLARLHNAVRQNKAALLDNLSLHFELLVLRAVKYEMLRVAETEDLFPLAKSNKENTSALLDKLIFRKVDFYTLLMEIFERFEMAAITQTMKEAVKGS